MCFASINHEDNITIMGYDHSEKRMDEEDIEYSEKKMMGVSQALKAVLVTANKEDRLVAGLLQAGETLDMNADGVMMCILPEKIEDFTLRMHYTLIESFCRENEIIILKVDSTEKIRQILGNNEVNANSAERGDLSCILVEFPEESSDFSEDEETIIEYYKDTYDTVPQPTVNLDV